MGSLKRLEEEISMIRLNKAIALMGLALAIAFTPIVDAQQVSPIKAKLVIPDAKVLPGVPFDMWIEVQNGSDAAVAVGLFPQLLVRPDHGESFELAPLDKYRSFPVLLLSPEGDEAVPYLQLAPGEH